MTLWGLVRGFGAEGRMKRYAFTLLGGYALIIGLALSFYIFAPRSYSSGFTLILPGAGPSSSVNLETLGQASSNSASPFSSPSLSPTENYKKLFQSYRLRGRVAEELDLAIDEVPAPRIRLANQTKLIYASVSASSPEEAKALADTWLTVFAEEIDALRLEEQLIREQANKATLDKFEAAVEASRADIIDFQTKYGLISVEQFQNLVQRSGALKVEAQEATTEAAVMRQESRRLSGLLKLTPESASDILSLQSDPVFQSIYRSLADAESLYAGQSQMFGVNHPERRATEEEVAGLRTALQSRGRLLIGFERYERLGERQHSVDPERKRLMASLVQASSSYYGITQKLKSLNAQIDETAQLVKDLAGPATELDGLLREHQIAETVFASALARIDTNRTDIFASYPLAQTIEEPTQPSSPSSPSKKLITIGVVGSVFLYTLGLILLWIRLPIIRMLLKTV